MSYAEKVKAANLAARDVLRAGQVRRRLSKVSSLKNQIEEVDKEITDVNERSTIAVVEAEAMPTAHPRRAKAIEAANKLKENNDKFVADTLEKQKADLAKEITEVETEINDIEAGNGKIKVDKEPMIELSKKFVEARFQEAYVAGEYDADAKKAAKSE